MENNSHNITYKCSFKQCRSLKLLNKDNKFILLFSYVKKRSFQMCAHADVLNQENYSCTITINIEMILFCFFL
jgi:hypothetical protein